MRKPQKSTSLLLSIFFILHSIPPPRAFAQSFKTLSAPTAPPATRNVSAAAVFPISALNGAASLEVPNFQATARFDPTLRNPAITHFSDAAAFVKHQFAAPSSSGKSNLGEGLLRLGNRLGKDAGIEAGSRPAAEILDRFYAGSAATEEMRALAGSDRGGTLARGFASRGAPLELRARILTQTQPAVSMPGTVKSWLPGAPSTGFVAALVVAAGFAVARRLWKKSTVFKLALTGPLIALALPLGRLEVRIKGRPLMRSYPNSKILGGGHSNVVLRAKDPDGRSIIVKQYGISGSLLGWLSHRVLPTPTPAGVSRRARFESDRDAFKDFEKADIPASRLLRSDSERLINVNSFIAGKPLLAVLHDPAAIRQSARSLRLAHDRGWAIIDNQPSNFMIGQDGRAYFIDLEHAYRDAEKRYSAWDIGTYLTWLEAGLGTQRAKAAESAFWEGYGSVSNDLEGQVSTVRKQMGKFRWIMKFSFKDSAASSRR